MTAWLVLGVLLASSLGVPGTAHASPWGDRGREGLATRGAWKEEYRDGPCRVKEQSKSGEFKREIKCKDGVGADWHGEWKREFWDGPCKVTIDAKRDEYKEEVKCEQ